MLSVHCLCLSQTLHPLSFSSLGKKDTWLRVFKTQKALIKNKVSDPSLMVPSTLNFSRRVYAQLFPWQGMLSSVWVTHCLGSHQGFFRPLWNQSCFRVRCLERQFWETARVEIKLPVVSCRRALSSLVLNTMTKGNPWSRVSESNLHSIT